MWTKIGDSEYIINLPNGLLFQVVGYNNRSLEFVPNINFIDCKFVELSKDNKALAILNSINNKIPIGSETFDGY